MLKPMPTDGSLGYFQFFRITFHMHNNSCHIIYKQKAFFFFTFTSKKSQTCPVDNK